jgi:hypothetical protein
LKVILGIFFNVKATALIEDAPEKTAAGMEDAAK